MVQVCLHELLTIQTTTLLLATCILMLDCKSMRVVAAAVASAVLVQVLCCPRSLETAVKWQCADRSHTPGRHCIYNAQLRYTGSAVLQQFDIIGCQITDEHCNRWLAQVTVARLHVHCGIHDYYYGYHLLMLFGGNDKPKYWGCGLGTVKGITCAKRTSPRC